MPKYPYLHQIVRVQADLHGLPGNLKYLSHFGNDLFCAFSGAKTVKALFDLGDRH